MIYLPPELVLSILSYLPLNSLGKSARVCRRWRNFLEMHESPIYHRAALLHGYISSAETFLEEAARQYSERSMGEVVDWKGLCQKRRYIERSWTGTGPSRVTAHTGTGKSVHRIKVDETAGYILTTRSDGGLFVTDLQSDQELWSLPDNHVRPYAHCEYGGGFVIFDYIDGSKEVWRHLDSWNDDEVASVASESRPTARQLRVFAVAEEKYAVDAPGSTRGHFRPWAILRPPQLTRAFRFYYPTLGVAGSDNIYLWDVRTGTLIQTIEQTQLGMHNESPDTVPAASFLGDINYIEVSEKYVFLCGTHFLRVFSRASGKSVMEVSSSKHPLAAWHLSISPTRPTTEAWDGASLVPQEVVCYRVAMPESPERIQDEFIGVHISPCGSHLAALMMSSRLIIIHDFERALQPNVKTFDISIEVQLGSPCLSSRYLAFENGRISVATKTGVFIVQPDWKSLATTDPDSPPNVTIFRVPVLGDPSCLAAVSCLQMTDTGLFLNWDTDFLPEADDDSLEYMDDRFYDTLTNERRIATVTNGFAVMLVDLEGELNLFNWIDHSLMPTVEPDIDPESSTVVSIDFMMNPP